MASKTYSSTLKQLSIETHIKLLRLQNLLIGIDLCLRDTETDHVVLAGLEAARKAIESKISTLLPTESDNVRPISAEVSDVPLSREDLNMAAVRGYVLGPTVTATHALCTLRIAANAFIQWDMERDVEYGLGNVLTEYAGAVRNELFGSDP
jgi:hypothetical protein